MIMPILVGICTVILLGAAEASAEQQGKSPRSSAGNDTPKSIACAQERGAPLGQCSYRIKRDENGKTKMTVVFANYGGQTGGLASAGRSAIWSDRGVTLAELTGTGSGLAIAAESDGGWVSATIRSDG